MNSVVLALVRKSVPAMLGAVAIILSVAVFSTVPAYAARHAFIVGVSKYDKAKGIESLNAPANDAEQLKRLLEDRRFGFRVEMVRDEDVKDKAAFEAAFERFLSQVREKDEVVFYFSGHGFYIPQRSDGAVYGNFFMLPDARSKQMHLKDMGGAAARALDTQEKRDRSYEELIAQMAVSERSVQEALERRKADVIVIIADACRSLIANAKGASLEISSTRLPKEISRGVFRLYSASEGQISLDAPDRPSVTSAQTRDRKDDDSKKATSLFTRVLLKELVVPGVDINILAARIKVEVRDQARKLGSEQVPDFVDDKEATRFAFVSGDASEDIRVRCQTAPTELAALRFGVSTGSIGRATIERKRFELAPCDMADEVENLLKLEAQGAGSISTSVSQIVSIPQGADATQTCDLIASSPLDTNRPQGLAGVEIQKVALAGTSGEIDRNRAVEFIKRAISSCETASVERPRVARFKYNLARSHYALATLDTVERSASLEQASHNFEDAVNLGYPAAYNPLGQMLQNGEYYVLEKNQPRRQPIERDKALELFKRGAELGDFVAQYNLGLAYKNGDYGAKLDGKNAFVWLSRAAEAGFVPAMIETAQLLRRGQGVDRNPKRAVELLEIAASRNSSEAMYWLGEIYYYDRIQSDINYADPAMVTVDHSDAIVWYARAAEAGDTRAQERLASMLTNGDGLPAQQPEAAGRYWRLAAEGGSLDAQMTLAGLIKNGKIPFRPNLSGQADQGAREIRGLYESAFARGKPMAGLELARLFRTGFPVGRGSDAVPKDPEIAVKLLWDTMDRVRSAEPDSDDANPLHEVSAAFELIKMYDAGENRRRDGSAILTEDQINLLKTEYGDPTRTHWIRVSAVGDGIRCRSRSEFWVYIWNWKRPEPPTEAQFDWFERRYNCKDAAGDTRVKPETLGIPKRTRDVFRREYEAAAKDKTAARTFVDRMVDLVSGNKAKR